MKKDIITIINSINLDDLKAQIKAAYRKARKLHEAGDRDAAYKIEDKACELEDLEQVVKGYREEKAAAERESIWAYRYYYSLSPYEEDNSNHLVAEHNRWADEYLKDAARILGIAA